MATIIGRETVSIERILVFVQEIEEGDHGADFTCFRFVDSLRLVERSMEQNGLG